MIALEPRIYLASRSPRRRELLSQIGVRFELLMFRGVPREDPDVDEAVLPEETPEDYVVRDPLPSALAAVRRIRERHLIPHPVLAADTTVEIDGSVIGKPEHEADAVAILQRLSGRTHRVLTAVALSYEGHTEHLLNAGTAALLADTDSRALIRSIMDEVVAAAAACGFTLPSGLADKLIEGTTQLPDYLPSMYHDHAHRRPLELTALYVAPLAAAEQAGCAMPRTQALYRALSFLARHATDRR